MSNIIDLYHCPRRVLEKRGCECIVVVFDLYGAKHGKACIKNVSLLASCLLRFAGTSLCRIWLRPSRKPRVDFACGVARSIPSLEKDITDEMNVLSVGVEC